MGREVKSAKAYAQNHTNSNDNSVFKKSKHEFEEARRRFNDSKQKTQIAKDKFAKSKKVFEESKSKLALIKNQQSVNDYCRQYWREVYSVYPRQEYNF